MQEDAMLHGDFEFRGNGGSYFWLVVWTSIVNVITAGLAYPWTLTARERWKAQYTYIDGKQLIFLGTGLELFGTWLVIFVLSILTIGIYLPWGACRLERWRTNNLRFASTEISF